MKTRVGFVSNSSSCSFTVPKKELSPVQTLVCRKRVEAAQSLRKLFALSPKALEDEVGYALNWTDEDWHMEEDDDNFYFNTHMDNFDLIWLFHQFDIPVEDVES